MPRLLVLPRLRPPADAGSDRDLVRRYALAADPEAFAELVRRHGPAVLGVCRRAARDPHLADDAFQATFLVLARRAASLRDPAAVGSWLFGVARRTATAARRRELRRAGGVSPLIPDHQGAHAPRSRSWDDLLAVLDAELARLPDKLRAPLLCCYHDGRTQDEAARHLGLSLSTVRRRLDRGRELLKVRMTARGATLGAGLFGGVLAPAVAVPTPLVRAAVDHAAGGPVPAGVLALAAAGPAVGKWLAAAVVFVAGGLAVGFGGTRPADDAPKAAEVPPPPRVAEPPDPLPKGAVARMGSPRLRHPGGVGMLAFGLGGKVIVTDPGPTAQVWDAATGRLLRTLGSRSLEAGADEVGGVGLLADGKTLVLTGHRRNEGGGFRMRHFVWDLERDAEVRVMLPDLSKFDRRGFTNIRVFSPDGSLMAEVAGFDGKVHLLDRDGMPAGDLAEAVREDFWASPRRLAFSPDGAFLFVAREDRGVIVWDTKARKPLRTLGEGCRPVAVAASADGKLVAAFDAAVQPKDLNRRDLPVAVRVWDPGTGKPIAEFPWEKPDPDGGHHLFIGFLPDGSVWALAASDAATTFRQWDRQSGRQVRDWTFPLVNSWVSAAAVSPDGSRVAVCSGSGLVSLFDAATGRDVTPAGGHKAEVHDLRFTPDGRHLRTAGNDEAVRTWDAATGAELAVARGLDMVWLSPDAATAVEYRHAGFRRARETATIVRDAADGRERFRVDGPGGLWQHPDGKHLWRCPPDAKQATVLDRATGKELGTAPVPGFPAGSADGGRLVVLRDDAAVSGYDAATGAKRFAWDAKKTGLLRSGPAEDQPGLTYVDAIHGAAVAPDGKRLAVILSIGPPIDGAMAAVAVCDLTTGKELWRVTSTIPSYFGRAVTFGPDGTTVAVGGERAYVYDAATGRERAKFEGHMGKVSALTFSPDGSRLATGGSDGTAVVWELPRK